MPLIRLKSEYLEQDGVRLLTADETGNTVSCRVSHEALEPLSVVPHLVTDNHHAHGFLPFNACPCLVVDSR
jgi:hypothetical protein